MSCSARCAPRYSPQECTDIATAVGRVADLVDGTHVERRVENQLVDHDRIIGRDREPEARRDTVGQFKFQMCTAIDDRVVADKQNIQIAGIRSGLITGMVDPMVNGEIDTVDVAFEDPGTAAVEYLPRRPADRPFGQPFVTDRHTIQDLALETTTGRIAVRPVEPRKTDSAAIAAEPGFTVVRDGMAGRIHADAAGKYSREK